MKYSLSNKWLIVIIPVVFIISWTFLNLKAPVHQANACQLFQDYPSWYYYSKKAQKRWGLPISVQLAIMRSESHFRADAKPARKMIWGVIPWFRPSTAEGYMQATDPTWRWYLDEQHIRSASRSSYANAVDFVGWYCHHVHKSTGVLMSDAYQLYLAYYLGIGGYQSGAYLHNDWLQNKAHQVQQQALVYHQQLVACADQLPDKPWWLFWD